MNTSFLSLISFSYIYLSYCVQNTW